MPRLGAPVQKERGEETSWFDKPIECGTAEMEEGEHADYGNTVEQEGRSSQWREEPSARVEDWSKCNWTRLSRKGQPRTDSGEEAWIEPTEGTMPSIGAPSETGMSMAHGLGAVEPSIETSYKVQIRWPSPNIQERNDYGLRGKKTMGSAREENRIL